MNPPKKYLKVNGTMQLNPEYKRWQEAQSGGTKPATTVARPDPALPVETSMDDHMQTKQGMEYEATPQPVQQETMMHGIPESAQQQPMMHGIPQPVQQPMMHGISQPVQQQHTIQQPMGQGKAIPAGAQWLTYSYVGDKTWTICTLISVITCFCTLLPCGVFAFLRPCDEKRGYEFNGVVYDEFGQAVGPTSKVKIVGKG